MEIPNATQTRSLSSDDIEWDRIWRGRCELLNWAGITYRYHRKRQRFFDMAERLTQVATVAGGVAVLGKTLGEHLPWIGAAITFVGLLALVFAYSDKRQCHKELAEKAMQLAGEIEALPPGQLEESHIATWTQRRAQSDLQEPPNLKTLVAKCEWEQAVAEGHPNHTSAPRWWQQAYMHFF